MAQKKYWKGLEELQQTPEHQQLVDNEFRQDLETVGVSDELLQATTPRRDFLKYVGFSTLAATVAASCEMPVRHAIPYAIKPEEIVPGVANYYASSFVDNGDYCSVIVKTREGRPIMIEGNKSSSVTAGGATPRVIAATLSLYDKTRLRHPLVNGESAETFDLIDTPIKQALTAANGQIYLVTGSIISPTTKEVIRTFLSKYPGAKHITYDPISYSGMLLANEATFGKRALPSYNFGKADTIFSLAADFLGTWLAPSEFAGGFMKNRKITAANPVMNKHYQVEGMMSMTGSNADERATCRPSEYGRVAAALYSAIVNGTTPNLSSDNLNRLIVKAAADLKKGNGLVVSGSNDVNVQIIVNAINNAIGAYESTIDWSRISYYKQGIDAEFEQFVDDMNSGQVKVALFHNINPAYDYHAPNKFTTALAKVSTTVSFNDRLDETTELVKFVVPDHHWLESWGDAEPKTGMYSFIQPTIAPLFKTRSFQDSLLTWAGEDTAYEDYWRNYWTNKIGGQNAFHAALQQGIYETAVGGGVAQFNSNIEEAVRLATVAKSDNTHELVVYESVAIGYGGAWSNNPWLQEMPDPITRSTWDNYVCMSPKTAKEQFDAELTGINQVDPKKRVVKLRVGDREIALPIIVIPGMHNDVVAVKLGYGRSKGVGLAAADLGANAYSLTTFNGQTREFNNPVTIEKTSDFYSVALTQTHHSYEGRNIIREYTLEEFKNNPRALINERKDALKHYTHLHWEGHHEDDPNADFDHEAYEKNGTLYPVHDKPGIHWGMSVDLNSCTGCGACVVACVAENNISIVGKDRVMVAQEMLWLRIDRYFSGDPDDPDTIQTVYQPMMCLHCDNAPCENVCPVSATNHSSEGLNQMAYNRCIGTKYCANNCPYKVRHFNWFDFNGADSFKDNLYKDGRRDDMNDDLTRMVLNPDVTVRSRGVMEKCTFCVQRLQEGKLKAKLEGRPLRDEDVSTACQRACGGDCFTFGNLNDPESKIYKERYVENKERVFYVLEELHILPNVNYLSKIRNTDEVIAGDTEKDQLFMKHI